MTSLLTSPGFTVSVHLVHRCEGYVLRYNVSVHDVAASERRLILHLGSRVVAGEALESIGLSRRDAEATIEAALSARSA